MILLIGENTQKIKLCKDCEQVFLQPHCYILILLLHSQINSPDVNQNLLSEIISKIHLNNAKLFLSKKRAKKMKCQKSYLPSANKKATNNSDIDYKVSLIFSEKVPLPSYFVCQWILCDMIDRCLYNFEQ